MRAPPISTAMLESAGGAGSGSPLRTTRTIRMLGSFAGAPGRPRRADVLPNSPRRRSSEPHHLRVNPLYGWSFANSCSVLPLAFHSPTRSAQILSLSVMAHSIVSHDRFEKYGTHAPDTISRTSRPSVLETRRCADSQRTAPGRSGFPNEVVVEGHE